MNIKDKDINELKVMVYDLSKELEVISNNLTVLNKEISIRDKEKIKSKEEENK